LSSSSSPIAFIQKDIARAANWPPQSTPLPFNTIPTVVGVAVAAVAAAAVAAVASVAVAAVIYKCSGNNNRRHHERAL